MRKNRTPAWEKLDNTALLFPVIANEGMSSVYRLSVSLTEDVDPELLAKAQDKVLLNFTSFRMRLRAGVFWYYFEENDKKYPDVREESELPGAYINKSRNRQFMFRLSYYKKRINLEVFHALTDGAGGLVFLKEIVYQYLRYRHPELLEVEKDRLSAGIFLDNEDSYMKNFKKPEGGRSTAYKSKKAVTLKGEFLQKGDIGVLHGYIPLPQIKEAAKKHGVTINQYIVGTYIYSIYKEYLKGGVSDLPVNCCVPVDLRNLYDSHTGKNFFVMISAAFKPEKEEYSFEEVLSFTAGTLKEQMDKENLEKILSYNVSNEANKLLRPIPLFIKNIAIKQVYNATADCTTSTVTNVGRVEIRAPYEPYVEHFYAMLSMSKGQNMKAAVASFKDTMVITFSTILADISIIKRFFSCLKADNVDAAIETNGAWG